MVDDIDRMQDLATSLFIDFGNSQLWGLFIFFFFFPFFWVCRGWWVTIANMGQPQDNHDKGKTNFSLFYLFLK
jgi:hypothetical protein